MSDARTAELDAAGSRIAVAMLVADTWIDRTAESVRIVDRDTLEREITRHFRLPPREGRAGIDGGCIVPLFHVEKHAFVSCQVRGPDGAMTSLLTARDGLVLTTSALRWLAERVLGQKQDLGPVVASDLCRIAGTEITSADEAETVLEGRNGCVQDLPEQEQRRVLCDNEVFKGWIRAMASGYLVYAVVSGDDGRYLLSIQRDEQIPDPKRDIDEARKSQDPVRVAAAKRLRPRWQVRLGRRLGWLPHALRFRVRGSYGSAPYHVEFEAPEGVAVGRRLLEVPRLGIRLSKRGVSVRRARFRLGGQHADEASVRVNVHPGIGSLAWAWLPAIIVAGANIALGVDSLCSGEVSEAAASILLITPGGLAVLAVARGEHSYVTQIVFWLRLLALAPGLLAIVGATAIVTGEATAATLLSAGGIATAVAMVLGFAHRRSRIQLATTEYVEPKELLRIA